MSEPVESCDTWELYRRMVPIWSVRCVPCDLTFHGYTSRTLALEALASHLRRDTRHADGR